MKDQAIALCRVSTPEQIQNNSLNRQREAVELCAQRKDLDIVYWWSGSVSSKAGTNVKRKDLNEMLAFCKKNKRVKFLIVDEYDRFMRSSLEGAWYEVEFQALGVKVWFASEDDAFNADDAMGKLMRQMSAFKAEGSNEERIHKSIVGGQKSIRDGKLPSHPKAGYKKGLVSGVHAIDEPIALPLQRALKQIACDIKTPTDALKELMTTEFGKRHPKYKMDKFRKTACDCYYYGAVELKGKLNERNENGLHTPLISKTEHEKILRVFSRNPKTQQGQRPDKDIKYPLSNELTCITCELAERKYPRFTSVPSNNGANNHGKPRKKISYYTKYRCRECNRYLDRDDTHDDFASLLNAIILPNPEMKKLKTKLVRTFDAKHHETKGEIQRLEAINTTIQQSISQKADAVTDPTLITIRAEILASIDKLKAELADNQEKIHILNEQHDTDLAEFLDFALGFLGDKGTHFFELNGTDMKRCKQMIFTGKIYVDADKNVYTHDISSIFRGEELKRDTLVSPKSSMVQHS